MVCLGTCFTLAPPVKAAGSADPNRPKIVHVLQDYRSYQALDADVFKIVESIHGKHPSLNANEFEKWWNQEGKNAFENPVAAQELKDMTVEELTAHAIGKFYIKDTVSEIDQARQTHDRAREARAIRKASEEYKSTARDPAWREYLGPALSVLSLILSGLTIFAGIVGGMTKEAFSTNILGQVLGQLFGPYLNPFLDWLGRGTRVLNKKPASKWNAFLNGSEGASKGTEKKLANGEELTGTSAHYYTAGVPPVEAGNYFDEEIEALTAANATSRNALLPQAQEARGHFFNIAFASPSQFNANILSMYHAERSFKRELRDDFTAPLVASGVDPNELNAISQILSELADTRLYQTARNEIKILTAKGRRNERDDASFHRFMRDVNEMESEVQRRLQLLVDQGASKEMLDQWAMLTRVIYTTRNSIVHRIAYWYDFEVWFSEDNRAYAFNERIKKIIESAREIGFYEFLGMYSERAQNILTAWGKPANVAVRLQMRGYGLERPQAFNADFPSVSCEEALTPPVAASQ